MSLSRSLECSLKDYRTAQAARHSIPRYSVFGDTVLRQLVASRPGTDTELRNVRGMCEARVARYGEDILRLVRSFDQLPAAAAPRVIVRHPAAPRVVMRHRKIGKPKPAWELVLAPPANRTRAVLSLRAQPQDDQVYILELAQGKVYVGKSADVARRVGQHAAGSGAAWTKAYPPTGVLLPRLGNVRGSGDAAERDETLRYMLLRGAHNVRGWRYVAVRLTQAELDDAEANIRELFDLCRRCGGGSHFASACRAGFDRAGKPII